METRSTALRLAAFAATGLMSAGAFAAPAAAQENAPRNDFTGDGHADLVAVRNADGALLLYPGSAEGTFDTAPTVLAASGWAGMDVVMAGDLTSDGNADLLARDGRTGVLSTYPGDGAGGLGARVQSGTGWGPVEVFASNIDYDGDGLTDILATRKHDSRLFVYAGNGNGTFDGAVAYAGDYNRADLIVGTGDLDFDGEDDFMVRVDDEEVGFQIYRYHLSGGDGAWELTTLGEGSVDHPYMDQVAFLGNTDGDDDTELVSVDERTGALYRMSVSSNLVSYIHDHTVIGTGWNRLRLAESNTDRDHDFDMDGTSDLYARNAAGEVFHYPGTASGSIGSRVSMGSFDADVDSIETSGDLDGNHLPDHLARTTGGELYVAPGWGTSGAQVMLTNRIGTGWNTMSAIVSGADHSGDGLNDIIAREAATGYLWLYPGTAEGAVGPRTRIGTGWNAMSLITAVGDLDHDGAADLLARRNSDTCLYFYGGKLAGGLNNGVQIGCGWNVMNTIVSVGDFNADGHADWIGRHTNGNLYLYKGNGAGTYTASTVVGTGWSGFDIA
ncbi:FG-GAP repeat domain-containing protein [Glycomyces artemisiae]|uniref:VCBS repeat protein n=1 Tax=Glycomyces artemisiae TaxID=1076443 RepID=A0A2T0UT36_9ACTN|nr:VCBS repeat-containing protein [Glycomyces artemisiae]PRY61073.1 VCBS repeat protein [Glycomyces artemisiae]